MLHLALQEARLGRQRPGAERVVEGISVEVLGVDQEAKRETLTLRLQDVLVAGHRTARDTGFRHPRDSTTQSVERRAHSLEMLAVQLGDEAELFGARRRNQVLPWAGADL